MASHLPGTAQSLQLTGATSSPRDLRSPVNAVAGNGKLYTAGFGVSSFCVYDVSNPAAPVRLSAVAAAGRPRSLVLDGAQLYGASTGAGGPVFTSTLQLVDVSNALAPVITKSATVVGGPLGMALSATLLCVVTPGTSQAPESKLYVFDRALNLLNTITFAASADPYAVTIKGQYAYIATASLLYVYDLSVPTAPVLASTKVLSTQHTVFQQFVYNNYLYCSGSSGSDIYDISVPTAPVFVASSGVVIRGLSGATAYAVGTNTATQKPTLQAYDLRVSPTPTVPVMADIPSGIYGYPGMVPTWNNYAYAVSTGNDDAVQVFQYTPALLSAPAPRPADIALYPNPVTGEELMLELPSAGQDRLVTLSTLCGQTVRQLLLPAGVGHLMLPVNGLAPGMYLAKCGNIACKLVRQ
jgi:hypothetical protein